MFTILKYALCSFLFSCGLAVFVAWSDFYTAFSFLESYIFPERDVVKSKLIGITGTDLFADTEFRDHGFGLSSEMHLVITRSGSTNGITVASGSGLEHAKISSPEPKVLRIELPNLSEVNLVNSIVGFQLEFVYLPTDDPENRRKYVAWLHDGAKAENRAWYCENMFPHLSPANQSMFDSVYAHSLLHGLPDEKGGYCSNRPGVGGQLPR